MGVGSRHDHDVEPVAFEYLRERDSFFVREGEAREEYVNDRLSGLDFLLLITQTPSAVEQGLAGFICGL